MRLGDLKAVDLSDDSGRAPLSLDIFLLSVYLNLVFNLAGNRIILYHQKFITQSTAVYKAPYKVL